jgi:hypothetical protein
MSNWQPIETAPRDIVWKGVSGSKGPTLLLFPGPYGGVVIGAWSVLPGHSRSPGFYCGGWGWATPTHWMPLPGPPQR